ncbi:GYF domain-containing protein [Bradyrhizobium sp. CB2312]|uniref:GYF domain-containing protein n=1 Tax=Bradyrhizobium sp. CB2312 TaxID=3039155 RepID=UPI0024B13E12|nr:GYF domain-containing protein [Bradyrhizobium sp. CB2312]WFU73830.1 GYF domain-containing protein [Bradyrhizobium sp. CB2312]
MTDWYLWDGESQRGPMDRRELDNRIQYHPNPSLVRVWRQGFSGWQKVEDAFDVAQKSPLAPSTFERPLESTGSSKRQNVVAQHWRGEYPLGISYWLIGFIGNIAAYVVVAIISALIGGAINPIGILLFYISLWSFIVCLAIWQSVGIWRSAQHRIDQRATLSKRAPWAGLAKVMVCLSVLQTIGVLAKTAIPQIAEATRIAFMDDPDIPPYSIRVMGNGSEAEISGGIKFGLSDEFEKVLNASRGVRVVHLDSIGGRIGEGQKLNALIKTRGLDTYVDVKCLSACTLAFVAGRNRILKQGARLGFHRGAFAGEDQIDGSLERSIYAASGVSVAFVDRALATKNADMWRPSDADLVSAGVVTKVTSGDEYAIAGDGGRLAREDWDKGLQKASLVYRVMKEKYPHLYGEILDTFMDGTIKGAPQAQVIAEARTKLNNLIKARLPYADDAVLVDFGRLVVDQYRALQSQDKDACYRFASGQGDQNVIRLIPKELTERELELDARIISSSRTQYGAPNNDKAWEKIVSRLTSRGYSAKDLQLLTGTVNAADHARYCDLAIVLYQEIGNLPSIEAAALLREFFAPS